MTAVDDTNRAFTTTQIAELLDTDVWNVQRWVRRRDQRRWTGQGHYHRLTFVDVMVCRALQVIYSGLRGGTPSVKRAADLAVDAIDHRSLRWLLVSADGATTFDTAEEAALAWAESPSPAGFIVDLWSVPDA